MLKFFTGRARKARSPRIARGVPLALLIPLVLLAFPWPYEAIKGLIMPLRTL